MTIQADTLLQLTQTLRRRCGVSLMTDLTFTRAPYRENHHWICMVE